ncbi:uncharacterized protein LOC116850182 isoform X2 [Odontomachus brunneus]|nr:uncharacterized protein LOC116850182 isoform X2 [Odontomachus brunneus]XP_032684041.1 uncharacterized protein LOC116850182 isoform X2 [Odontomachus brunneus]
MTEFAIVEFVDGVQLVPKLWLQNNDTCYGPKLHNQSKYYKLVENKEPYNLQWEKYNIISVLAETDTFQKGLAKLKESEIFTDINTDIDEITRRKKRKRIQKGITSSSDENCDYNTEMEKFPSPLKQVNNKSNITVSTHFSSLRSHQSSSKPQCHETIKKYEGNKNQSAHGSLSQPPLKFTQQSGQNQLSNIVSKLFFTNTSNCSPEDQRHSPYRIPDTYSHTSSINMQSSSTCGNSYVYWHDHSPKRNVSYEKSHNDN